MLDILVDQRQPGGGLIQNQQMRVGQLVAETGALDLLVLADVRRRAGRRTLLKLDWISDGSKSPDVGEIVICSSACLGYLAEIEPRHHVPRRRTSTGEGVR